MKKLMRNLSKVTHSTQYSTLQSNSSKPRSDSVPAGHFPVYVGLDQDTAEKFIVNAELLHHPLFIELLHRSAQEYGYAQRGILRIPVNVVVFERVLESVKLGEGCSCLDELLLGQSVSCR
ncbi:hypothetical protein SADUNF_Sadunf03G0112600 [Salix dunnii]|uniref:Uncharacterized protein n=1 Tax=Salix dunnii TaxID=1413687 RepID=A0A835KGX9_9ROSI|nr:hypothetical protein SADUNF_Sadunf03G0112600 [Salix dunnii]